MSYVVLARKYRPRSFEQMVGQEAVVRALTNALERQRLHHAYLFTGTRGIGKTTVSRILAKSLNCTGPDGSGGITAHPCGVCQACTEIDADRYMDYVELDAASNRGIDEIRDLLERAAYKPSVGRFKVFMIDEAHQLTKESFNALLKTLEEPPEYLKFVLATTDPEKMLPTVLSRCLQFNLRPIAPEVVHEHLARVLDAEHVAAEPAALRLLARAARGSMRDALSLTDQAIAYGGGTVTEANVRAMLGSVDRGHAERLVEALARRDGAAVLAEVDALREHGLSASATLEQMAMLLQQMAVVQAVPDALDASDPDTAAARTLAAVLPPDETQLLYSLSIHGRNELALAPDEYAGLTMTLLRLFAFAPAGGAPRAAATPDGGRPAAAPLRAASAARATLAPPPAAAASRGAAPPASARRDAAPQPSPATSPDDGPPPWDDGDLDAARAAAPAPPPSRPSVPTAAAAVASAAAPATLVPTALGERWAAVVAELDRRQAIGALARELALQSELVAVDERATPPVWRLRVARESLRTAPPRDKLQAALAEHLGHALRLEVEAGAPADSPALRDAAERERRQREAEQIIHNDPVVQQLMSQFPTARIVPGSIKPHQTH
ncbi:DNA polymerase III subunit gamma/tau [Azohydromonas sediminis]|uniref:DNA polymerase III subunit gamma/tau n=1 Tax=Azohydromonas sediminis TaxID=2259674 RepID=UPI000E658587|nr:DNA polymerase III subunit gamma/tau [Azohydromonas sediminis]